MKALSVKQPYACAIAEGLRKLPLHEKYVSGNHLNAVL